MLKPEHLELLNKQVNREAEAANLYLSMSLWCRYKGLDGIAAFLKKQGDEESMHKDKLINYIIETGGLPKIGEVKAPQSEFSSVKELFNIILEYEKNITKHINELVDTFLTDKDYSTFSFLQWYVAEQHEEEHTIENIIDKINMIGDDGRGLFWLDKEVASMGKN